MNILEHSPITPQMQIIELRREVLQLKADLAAVTSLSIDCIFDTHDPQVFEDLYKSDFEKIGAALQQNPAALRDPAALTDVSTRIKKLYMLVSIAQRLTPPPPGSLEIVKS